MIMRWWTEINDVQSQTVVCSCWNKKMRWLILSVCVSGGTQNTIITVFVWSLTRLSTACRRTCSTWQWDNNLSIRNRGEISIPFLSFSLLSHISVTSLPSGSVCVCVHVSLNCSDPARALFFVFPSFVKSVCNWFPHWLNRWTLTHQFSLHSDQGKYS